MIKLAVKRKLRKVFRVLTCFCKEYNDHAIDQIKEEKDDPMASKFEFVTRNTRSGSVVSRQFSGLKPKTKNPN